MLERRWIKWGLIFCCWTLLGLLLAVRIKVSYAYSAYPISWARALAFALADWYGWAVLFPLLVWLADRFPFERQSWRRSLLVHLPASVLLSILKLLSELFLTRMIDSGRARTVQITQLSSALFTYYAILGVVYAFAYYHRARRHEMEAAQLAAQLAEAQLATLKMQLHPHFLFNTLHAISSLMRKDVEAADRMIVRLSDLLRLTLESGNVQEVPLKRELEFLERYLEIEQIRFRERLQVQLEVEPETLDACVPNLILQPLVENAIRHGIAPRSAPGRIVIRARRETGRLRLQVSDNGAGLAAGDKAAIKEGVGLANTRARLQRLYGANHDFELSGSPSQINLLIPAGAATGNATVTVSGSNGQTINDGTLIIDTIAPGLFTADATGRGPAAALALRVKADGAQSYEPIARFDPAQNKFVTIPIDLGPESEQVFLVLFGSGVRGNSDLGKVSAFCSGGVLPVVYAGAQGSFVGLDQINLSLPRTLTTRGEQNVVLTVAGRTANRVRINIRAW